MNHIAQAASCLNEDPSFRLITSIEEQRTEARAVLRSLGGNPDDADAVISLALGIAPVIAPEPEEIAVPKADFQSGTWKERRVQIRRPGGNAKASDPRSPGLIAAFMDATGMTAQQVGKLIGKSRPAVACYRADKLAYAPSRADLAGMRKALNAKRDAIAQLLEQIDAIERALPIRT